MNIDSFRNFILFVIRKSTSGGSITPTNFNLTLERAYIGAIMERYGNPHEITLGNPIPRMGWQSSQKVTDDLRFLLTVKTFSLIDGGFPVPDGKTVKDITNSIVPKYLHFSSLRYNHITQTDGVIDQKEIDIRPLKDTEIGSALSSHIAPPTMRFPVCAFFSNSIAVRPKTIQRVIFTYLKIPTTPKWAYTTVDKRPIYDSVNSVDIDAPDDMINDISSRMLSYLGISNRDINFVQYQEKLKQEGS